MTEKEFKAMLNGKKIAWDSGAKAEAYLKEYEENHKKKPEAKKRKVDPDEIVKNKIKAGKKKSN